MKIVIAGGTGLVGKRLQTLLKKQQAEIIILTSSGVNKIVDGIRYVKWMDGSIPEGLEDATAFINLAGVSLNEGRWTQKQKSKILSSRLQSTNEIIRIMKSLKYKPSVFVNASAVGIYKPSETEVYTEQHEVKVTDFLSDVVYQWEQAASQANELGIRTCTMRFGVILEKKAGAFPLMLLPYQLFVGGTIGSGKQWVSWIHAEDAARAILFAIDQQLMYGSINTVSPNPLRMRDFGKVIAEVFRRPHYFPVPSPLLKIALGEKSMLILEGQYVVPKKLNEFGFTFKYPSLQEALHDLHK
jgi:uncharacterized protein